MELSQSVLIASAENQEVKLIQYLTNFDGVSYVGKSQKISCCVMHHVLCFKRQKVVLQCVMCLVLQKVVLHRMTTNLGWYLALLSAKWRQTYSSQILYKYWDGNAMLSAKWSISPGDILPPKQYLLPQSQIYLSFPQSQIYLFPQSQIYLSFSLFMEMESMDSSKTRMCLLVLGTFHPKLAKL